MNDLIFSLFFDSEKTINKCLKQITPMIKNFLNNKFGFSIDLSVLSLIKDKVLEQY